MSISIKPVASLTPGLLARKGDARPAIARAYVPMISFPRLPVSMHSEADEEFDGDLGRDVIDEVVRFPAAAVATPVVVRQQERLARFFSAPATKAIEDKTRPSGPKKRFTLRLDVEHHQRLHLARDLYHLSAQKIVIQALDEFLQRETSLSSPTNEMLRNGTDD